MNWKDYKIENWDHQKVREVITVGDIKILVLLLTSDDTPVVGIKNMIAINTKDENIKWIADLPSKHGNYRTYSGIRFNDGILEAWSGSVYCIIDIETGKVLSEEFVK